MILKKEKKKINNDFGERRKKTNTGAYGGLIYSTVGTCESCNHYYIHVAIVRFREVSAA